MRFHSVVLMDDFVAGLVRQLVAVDRSSGDASPTSFAVRRASPIRVILVIVMLRIQLPAVLQSRPAIFVVKQLHSIPKSLK